MDCEEKVRDMLGFVGLERRSVKTKHVFELRGAVFRERHVCPMTSWAECGRVTNQCPWEVLGQHRSI